MNRGEVFTPPDTAKFMVGKLGKLANKRILEPSAGKGIFVTELLAKGANPERITAIDNNPRFEEIYIKLGVNYRISDFLLNETPTDPPELFDYVIGNPPYLSRHSPYIQAHKAHLRKRFREIGVYDTYSLFIYHGLSCLKAGGKLCFIVSDTFLTTKYHQKLRRFLLEKHILREITRAPRNLFANQGVNITPCIIVIEKRIPGPNHKVTLIDGIKTEQQYTNPPRIKQLPQRNFHKIDGYPISANINDFVAELFSSLPTIREVMTGHIGLHTHNNRKAIAAIAGTRLAREFTRKGLTVISPHLLSDENKWRPYLKKGGEEQYYREIEEAIDWSPEAVKKYDIPARGSLFLREGIVISGVSRRLAVRYMPAGCLWDSNKAIGFVASNPEISIWYLLGLLNSRLYNFLAKGIINNTSCLQIDNIRRLPFKYPDEETKSTVALLVKQVVKELKDNPLYDYSAAKQQIEELIFELYEVPEALRQLISQNF